MYKTTIRNIMIFSRALSTARPNKSSQQLEFKRAVERALLSIILARIVVLYILSYFILYNLHLPHYLYVINDTICRETIKYNELALASDIIIKLIHVSC